MKFTQEPPEKGNKKKTAEAVTETLKIVLVLNFYVKSSESMEAGAKAKSAATKAKAKAKSKAKAKAAAAKGKANTLENDKFRLSNCHSLDLMFEVFLLQAALPVVKTAEGCVECLLIG